MLMREERELIVEYGRKLFSAGLCPGTSGNISIYNAERGLMAISPSGISYFSVKPEDVVITDLHAKTVDGSRRPSSECELHTSFYRRKSDVRAVIHTHSLYCTAFAVLGQPIRAVHYVIGDAGTDMIPCAPYRTFGTAALAEAAVETCGDGSAVLLANHGIVVCGRDLDSAFSLTLNLEYVAQLQYLSMCAGTPNILTGGQMADVMERLKTYGQPGAEE